MSIIDRLPTLPEIHAELAELDARRTLLKRLKAAIRDQELSPKKRSDFLRSLNPSTNTNSRPDSR
jgi:hypothetical protein